MTELLKGMDEKTLHAHLRHAVANPSGRVLLEWLRGQCFMDPETAPPKWENAEQVLARYSRMTLFQALEKILQHST